VLGEVLSHEGVDIRDFSLALFSINLPELYRYYVPMDEVFFVTIFYAWGERKYDILTGKGLRVQVVWRNGRSQNACEPYKFRNFNQLYQCLYRSLQNDSPEDDRFESCRACQKKLNKSFSNQLPGGSEFNIQEPFGLRIEHN
jgi:hypothetical protein